MKRINIFMWLLVVGLGGCKKFLDLKPDSQIPTDNFYKNASDFQSALDGIYGTVRGLYSSSNSIYMGELSTDNLEIQWSSPSVSEMQLDQNAVTSTNSYTAAVWNSCLVTVSRCNAILNRIDKMNFAQATKDRIKGETRCLRGLANFYLVQIFGGVPLTDQEFSSPSQIQGADLSRQDSSKVYASVLSDLKQAEGLLPATLNTDKTSISIGAVKTILGKVYLTMHDYQSAADKLKEVIDAQQYSLATNYKTLFNAGNNNQGESIFEVQYVSGKSLGNNYSYLFAPAITSMAIFLNNQQGAGRMVPTLNMINSYEAGDLRKAASVNDSVLLVTGKKTYNRYGLKFVDFQAVDVTDGSVTYTVLRYADVLLMYAEALNELHKTVDALPYFNLVHQRAGLTGLTSTPSEDDFRLIMEKERRVEFLYEGWRWYDLRRTGRLKDVLNAAYAAQGLSYKVDDFELLFPVPQGEIDLNPAVKQNPDY